MNKLKQIIEEYRFYLVGMCFTLFGVILSQYNNFIDTILILMVSTIFLSLLIIFKLKRNKK